MNPGYPPYPSQQMPTPGQYPLYPSTTSQTNTTMSPPFPSQPGFNTGYPPQPSYPPQPGYPPAAGGYPPQPTSGYPQPTSGYPPQSTYPPAAAPSYPPAPGYPQAPAGGPPASYPGQPTCGYPQQSAFPSYGQQCPAPQSQHLSAGGAQVERPTPTIIPVTPFNPRSDAEILRKAMKGFGTDEKAIINVLTKRSNRQRLDIANEFKAMYGKDLISDVKSELSGKFEDLMVAALTPLPEFLASELRYAMEGAGTDESTLVEILCSSSNAEIYAIKDAYGRLYNRSLENDLRDESSGHFKRLLVSVVQGRRSENYAVDERAASSDAQQLMAAGVMRIGTDESTFNAILCTRSYPHLRRVFMEYQRLAGRTMEQAIDSEFSGDIKKGLLAIVHSVEDKPGFFAERIRNAVAGAGTKDRQLIRIVVWRCEMDMQSIKRAYAQRYGRSLEQAIDGDTSGDYRRALLALVGN